jgi:hypothetical protein
MRARSTVAVVLVLLAAGTLVEAGTKQVRVQLMVRPELNLSGTERVYIGPILLEPQEEAVRRVDINAVREFERYLRTMLRRQTRLTVLPPVENLELPTTDPTRLVEDGDFWRSLAERTDAEYIVAASIDVVVLDRAGYQTEQYVSPEDGKTYFRQVLVEETGFKYDILLAVVDASGTVVHSEQISDFKEREERKLEEFKDMYDNLYTLENRLLGVFVPRMVQARRYLYTG